MLSIYIYLAYTNNIHTQGVLIVKKKTLSSFLKNPNQFSELKPVYARFSRGITAFMCCGTMCCSVSHPALRQINNAALNATASVASTASIATASKQANGKRSKQRGKQYSVMPQSAKSRHIKKMLGGPRAQKGAPQLSHTRQSTRRVRVNRKSFRGQSRHPESGLLLDLSTD